MGASPVLAASRLGDRTPEGTQASRSRDGAGGASEDEGALRSPRGCVGSGGRMWWGPCWEQGLHPVASGPSCRTGRTCSARGRGDPTCLEGLR